VVVKTSVGTKVTATCAEGSFAIGGGGMSSSNRTLDGSYPSTAAGVPVTNGGASPTSWTASFSQTGTQTAYVICAVAPAA
jgi:hypothetical protein